MKKTSYFLIFILALLQAAYADQQLSSVILAESQSQQKSTKVTIPFDSVKVKKPGEQAEKQKYLENFFRSVPEWCRTSGNFKQIASCAKKYFVIDGEPINPLIIKDLGTWLSDGGDQVVAINLLDSQRSNRYFHDKLSIEGLAKNSYKISAINKNASFSYVVQGITASGIIILKTADWGDGGTGVFTNLLFVRIRMDNALSDTVNDKISLTRKRILIEKLGYYPLGDRVNNLISVSGNTIRIDITEKQLFSDLKKEVKKITIYP